MIKEIMNWWKSRNIPKTFHSEWSRGYLAAVDYMLDADPTENRMAYMEAIEDSAYADGVGKGFGCGWMDAYEDRNRAMTDE